MTHLFFDVSLSMVLHVALRVAITEKMKYIVKCAMIAYHMSYDVATDILHRPSQFDFLSRKKKILNLGSIYDYLLVQIKLL